MRREKNYKEELGLLIEFHREKKGLAKKELADHLNVSRMTVSNWESGKSACDYYMFRKLIHLLQIPMFSVNEILTGY